MAGGNVIKNNIIGIVILCVALFVYAAGIYTDWLWFDSLSYGPVFKTIILSKIGLGVGVGLFFFVFLTLNFLLAKKWVKQLNARLYMSIIAGLSTLAGLFSSTAWFTVLRFMNYTEFGFMDPLFQKDIGFYTFVLPFYQFAIGVVFFALLLALGLVASSSLFTQRVKRTAHIDPDNPTVGAQKTVQQIRLDLPKSAKTHMVYLFGLLLLVLAAFFYLRRYGILFGHRGAVYGAGYTDVTIMLPLFTILTGIAVVAAIIAFSYFYTKNLRLVVGSLIFLFGVFFIGLIISGATQTLFVQPNEFNLEEEYLVENIKHTLFAYNLHNVQTRNFPISYDLGFSDIENNKATIDNVRLWDWRPLLETYQQLQLFRTYYDFNDVDVDRYMIDGQLRQVMVSARELDQTKLPSRTWVNEKLVFTHGYGAVVSPVNTVTDKGFPDLFVQDIPPKSTMPEIEITQPGIYFGERTYDFVITNSQTKEFDYPLDNENVFAEYDGNDGITMSSLLRRALFAIKLGSLNLLISSSVDSESKVLINRHIVQRAELLAPFLEYDDDPYLVISEGRLFWVIDAYTVSSTFPYSEPIFGFNYIRNSVKVVIDAYNGDVTYYVVDENEPLIKNYRGIFPTLFASFEDMPEDLKQHIRYPEDMLLVQREIYGTYHMKDPRVFYNKEDVWTTRIDGGGQGRDVILEANYLIMKLPGEAEEEFLLISPFVPREKENLIAWFSARSDPKDYGKLEVFELSKQNLTFGPTQIEARIDQDTEISQLLTLWDQQGSEVVRGNLLIIPIEDSFLYIQPVYLRASSSGAQPQLQRVIVAYGDKVVMEETLDDALRVVFDEAELKAKLDEVERRVQQEPRQPTAVGGSVEEKFEQASQLYDEAQAALAAGDFVTYAEKISALGEVLE